MLLYQPRVVLGQPPSNTVEQNFAKIDSLGAFDGNLLGGSNRLDIEETSNDFFGLPSLWETEDGPLGFGATFDVTQVLETPSSPSSVFVYSTLKFVGVSTVNPVPIPASVWLFGSGLLGLIGIARRKKAA
jgi:hypothetical protein